MVSYTDKQKPLLKDSSFREVPANGITAVAVTPVQTKSNFQEKILATDATPVNDYIKLDAGNAHAMLFQLGAHSRRLYVYLEDDDNKYSRVNITVTGKDGKRTAACWIQPYPFEFTLPADNAPATFQLSLADVNGQVQKSKKVELAK